MEISGSGPETTADPGASPSRRVAADAECRQREARHRLGARAAECEDPVLKALLARAADSNRCRAKDTGMWLRGHAPSAEAPTASVGEPTTDGPGPLLLRRGDLTADLLILQTQRPQGFAYRAGQHVKLGLPGALRTFSLVSAPHEPHLEFFVELVPGGRLAEQLRTAQPGTAMDIAPRAKGDLRLQLDLSNHLMVATVTGIAPYISLLRDYFHGGGAGHRFIVLAGASHSDELGYREELEAMAAGHPEALVYVPTVSRPHEARNASWNGATGRVDAHAATAPQDYGLSPQDTAVYACGNPGMVDTVAGDLKARGFRVLTEPYD